MSVGYMVTNYFEIIMMYPQKRYDSEHHERVGLFSANLPFFYFTDCPASSQTGEAVIFIIEICESVILFSREKNAKYMNEILLSREKNDQYLF